MATRNAAIIARNKPTSGGRRTNYNYPDTYLTDADIATLRGSRFLQHAKE